MKTLNLVPRAEMSAALLAICLLITCASFTTVNPLLTLLSQMINKPPPPIQGKKVNKPPPPAISLLSIPPRPFLFFTNK